VTIRDGRNDRAKVVDLVGWRSVGTLWVLLLVAACSGGGETVDTAVDEAVATIDATTDPSLPPPDDDEQTSVATSPEPIGPAMIERAGHGDPETVDLPALEESDDVTGYFATDSGETFLRFLEATEALWMEGGEGCDATLEAVASVEAPDAVLAAAEGVPDDATGDILEGLVSASIRLIGECNAGAVSDQRVGDFAWQRALAMRRLTEIGVIP
jgi:hypothetical protein